MSMQPERLEFSDRVEYRLTGKRHRMDGPAIEWASGSKEWYLNGKRHRLNGPAREWADGDKEWYINGKYCDKTKIDSFRLKTLTLSFVVNRRIWKKVI